MTGVSALLARPRLPVHEPGVDGSSACGRILVVEDDAHVRCVLALALELAGHEVHQAGDADEALSLLERLPPLDLVVMDVGLPRLGGVELARRLDPAGDLAVIFITGHADDVAARLGLPDGVPRLRKPFSPAQLAAAVEARLAATNRAAA
jgi:CheY-like chemotaxis protein